jgi:DNA modification methylase
MASPIREAIMQKILEIYPNFPDGTAPLSAGHNDRWTIDWWATEKLWQDPDNPRRYSKRDLERAENILRRFGFRMPLIIRRDGCVLSQFHLVAVARKLGHEQLPVLYADDLSEPEQRALTIGLNRLYDLGKLLGGWLQKLEVEIPDLRFDDLGLDQTEGDLAILHFENGQQVEDAPAASSGPLVSCPGDIWELGLHRVACCDATRVESYERILGGQLAAMVWTDPPYGIRVDKISTRGHEEFVQGSRENPAEMQALFKGFCGAISKTTRPGALIYMCIDWRSQQLLSQVATIEFGEPLNLIVWAKDRPGMGSLYRSQHELVLLHRAPGGSHRNNVELGRHGRNRSNVWHYPSALTLGKTGVEGDLLADHPTPKPVQLVADAILDCTRRHDIVLDPFLGSGTTVIAAEKTGRICLGMDLDPRYVDLTVRRWQNWTGLQAVHAESGVRFDELPNISEEVNGYE